MTAIAYRCCLPASRTDHHTAHRCKLLRWEITPAATRHCALTAIADLKRIIVDFVAAQNRLLAEITDRRFLSAIRTNHRAIHRRKLV